MTALGPQEAVCCRHSVSRGWVTADNPISLQNVIIASEIIVALFLVKLTGTIRWNPCPENTQLFQPTATVATSWWVSSFLIEQGQTLMSWKSFEKVLRNSWETPDNVMIPQGVLRKSWEIHEKVLKMSWEHSEKVLKNSWKSPWKIFWKS